MSGAADWRQQLRELVGRQLAAANEEGEDRRYLRIRTGRIRRESQVVHSDVRVFARSVAEIASDLESRLYAIASIEPCWVEAIHKGESTPIDLCAIPALAEEPTAQPKLGTEASAMERLASVGVHAIERTNRDLIHQNAALQHELRLERDRANAAALAMLDAMKDKAEAEVGLALALQGQKSDVQAALETFGPIAKVVALKLAGHKSKRKQLEDKQQPKPDAAKPDPDAEKKAAAELEQARRDLEESVDAAINLLVEASRDFPDLITAERIERMQPMVLKAMGWGASS